MAAPRRGNTGSGTYFITAATVQKQQPLQSDRMARLFLDVLLGYRLQEKYLLHEFVLMPDHFHLLITDLNVGASAATYQRRLFFSGKEGARLSRRDMGEEFL
jgi:REP element-mobilizing transposase RayT